MFNVGAGVPVDVLTVAHTVARNLGADVPITVTGNFRLGDIRHNYACLQKVRALLGFEPQYDFERGVALFCAWARQQGSRHSDFSGSLREMEEKGLLKNAAGPAVT